MTKRLLLAGPDDIPRRSLKDQITRQGFEVTLCATAEAARKALGEGGFDALILDADLDGAIGPLCEAERERGWRGPILVLGPGGAIPGANETLAKPVRVPHLLQRLAEMMRGREPEAIPFGPYRLDAAARVIDQGDGRRLPLTEKEVAILSYLSRAPDRAVSREELLAEVWGYAEGATTHTVETHIYRLRRKLGEELGAFLVTEPAGGGYRLGNPPPADVAEP